MSKIGNAMGQAAESVVKAGGVVTKRGGEMISGLGKSMGVSQETCNKIENKTDDLGKDMYYASGSIGRSMRNMSEDIENGTKKAYQSMKDKMTK